MSGPGGRSVVTPDQAAALEAARELVRAGVPLFLARADPSRPTGYAEPYGWQHAEADEGVVDAWRPGMALCAVMGHALDLIDLDPRSGGELPVLGPVPVLGRASTPSGGTHLFVAPLGVRSRDGVWPGVDLKSGLPDAAEREGRGYAFIAPTVRRSKVDGVPRAYRWDPAPVAGRVRDAAHVARTQGVYGGLAEVRRRVLDLRAARPGEGAPRRLPRSAARAEWDRACAALEADVRRWAASGWGGEAHAGLLRHSTHLARLSPDHAEAGYLAAFAAAGVVPDDDDLTKLRTAVDSAVPDEVVPDEECAPQELFWSGVQVTEPPKAQGPPPDPLGRAERGAFAFLTEEEAEAIPPPDPLVEGLLFLGTKARLFGESTSGKTWVALDLLAHVSLGLPWLGRPVKQGPALYVAAEGAPSFAPRMRTWAAAHDGRRSGVRFWPEPVAVGGPSWGAFCDAVTREGFVLVVGDTQAAMTVGRGENDNDDAAAVHSALTELVAASGCCYLSVHHVGWAEQGRPRGASGMFGGMDTELRLAEGAGGLLVVTEKQRYAEKAPPVRLRLAAGEGGLVVSPPAGEAEGLLPVGDDRDVEVANWVGRLTAYADSGGPGLGAAGRTSVERVIRDELLLPGEEMPAERLVRLAAQAFKRSRGVRL